MVDQRELGRDGAGRATAQGPMHHSSPAEAQRSSQRVASIQAAVDGLWGVDHVFDAPCQGCKARADLAAARSTALRGWLPAARPLAWYSWPALAALITTA